MFEKEKYYKYIKTLEGMNTATYAIVMTISIISGAMTNNLLTLILSALLGFLFANIITFCTKMKIQKMRWEIDIYDKIYKDLK